MLPRRVLLAADLDGRVHVKDRLLVRILDVQEVFDRLLLVLLHITVQQECRIVLVVIDVALSAALRLFLIANELVQILDQVVQLRHLNVVLNDITRIQEANSLDILFDRFVVLLLVEEFVGVLFDNLTLDLAREVRLFCDGLRLSVV